MNLTDNQKSALVQEAFDTAEDGIAVLDRDFKIVLANRALQMRFGRNGPLAGQRCYAALFGRHDSCPACPYIRSLDKEMPGTQVMKVSAGQLRPDWLELSVYPYRDGTGVISGAIEFFKDVTKRKELEEQVREEAAWRHLLVDQSRDGVLILDLDGRVRDANPEFASTLGYELEEVRQLHLWDIDTQWDDKARFLEVLQRADISGDRFDTQYRRKDGTQVSVEVNTTGIVSGGAKLVLYVSRDVSEKKALEEQIRQLGIRDLLTGLYDRHYIFERLGEIASEYSRLGTHFCISILDIDRFSSVNEIHGHHAGDLALEKFAQTLSSAVRPYDLVGRYGGKQFIIVSRNATAQKTTAMIQRIMGMVRGKDFVFTGHAIRLTFSCGLAHSSEFARDSLSIEDMVTRAEARLHQAKVDGRDRCVGTASHRTPETAPAQGTDRAPG